MMNCWRKELLSKTYTSESFRPILSPRHCHARAHVDKAMMMIMGRMMVTKTVAVILGWYLSACLHYWQCLCSLGCCCCHCCCCSCKSIIRYTCVGGHISHNTFLLLLLLLILFATLTTALTAETTKPRNPKEDILFSATHSVSVS